MKIEFSAVISNPKEDYLGPIEAETTVFEAKNLQAATFDPINSTITVLTSDKKEGLEKWATVALKIGFIITGGFFAIGLIFYLFNASFNRSLSLNKTQTIAAKDLALFSSYSSTIMNKINQALNVFKQSIEQSSHDFKIKKQAYKEFARAVIKAANKDIV